ncbi:helix-turn-helix domain-containing protein [Chitinophaga sp. sic0106]|uniref:winged helix-turn-helix transcriptional regulator n=1 Tax=Chitinophaga sp. sic0106 TaxID=2854785 RepID=UPI001C48D20C|nr:helix-turn-helix domain-containing protein [Chitinophaga sp. sic0106]MBV7530492.1 helix-turn-helix transcriptional regulator [Chitinophaga sp. sic0106]
MEIPALQASKCAAQLSAVEDAMYVLGGKWKLRIIIALMTGYNRFNELQRAIKGISARVLSTELKSLELNGLVQRVVKADQTPVIVEYLPTDYAKTLKPMIVVLGEWGSRHKKRITGKG